MNSISVVITTYNQAPYIDAALNSVFAQTCRPLEVILVNDGSDDDTETKIRPFKHRIRYLYQENQGVAAARNTGIRAAKGDLLAFLDGDDLWEPEKLAKQLAAAQAYPDAGLIVADGVQFADEEILSSTLLSRSLMDSFPKSEAICVLPYYERMLAGNLISTTSEVMIPAKVLQRVGLSDSRFPLANDYDLYLRIAQHYEFVFIREPLVRWRYLPTSASGPAALRNLRWNEDLLAVQRSQLAVASAPFQASLRRFIAARVSSSAMEAYYYGISHDRLWAIRYLFRLLAKHPGSIAPAVCLLGLWSPSWLTRAVGVAARKLALPKA